jgi:hypothetical protein
MHIAALTQILMCRELGYPDGPADRSKDGVSVELGQGSSAAGSGLKPVDY